MHLYDNGDPAIQGIDSAYVKSLLPAGNIKLAANVTASSSQPDFSQVASQVMAASATRSGCRGRRRRGHDPDRTAAGRLQGRDLGRRGFAGVVAASASVANGLLFTSDIAPDSTVASTLELRERLPGQVRQGSLQFDAQGYNAVWLIARAEKAVNSSRSCLLKGLQIVTAASRPPIPPRWGL